MHVQPSSGARCLIFVGPFVYFHTSCVQTAKALARLHKWAGSPEPLLVAYMISTIISFIMRPTAAVLCPWARHFTPRKYWLITQEAMAPSRHDWKIVDWDVKPQHNQPTIYNAITQNICFIVGSHKYDVYLRDKNTCKVHLNWPNKDCISIFIERNVI